MEDPIAGLMARLTPETDAALIQSDVNRRYLTGMQSSAGSVLCLRDAAYLLIDFRYIESARQRVKNCQVLQQVNRMHQLRELLHRHGARTLAVEAMTMTLSEFAALKKGLESCVELDYSNMLSRSLYDCRMVKSPEEMAKIRAAQAIAETAFEDILHFIRPGVSEREIMLRLNQTMLENGSEGESFPTIVLTGAATSMPHGVPSAERVVQAGDFVLMDYGAVVDGYHSDMTRTVCVGHPTEQMAQVYQTVLQAQTAALQAARAGITGKALDKAARSVIADAGYEEAFGHALGHGVGLEIHEYPNAAPSSDGVLQPGNVVTVEPGIYLPGTFGVRIEDFVQITENGCENLTKAPKTLICLD